MRSSDAGAMDVELVEDDDVARPAPTTRLGRALAGLASAVRRWRLPVLTTLLVTALVAVGLQWRHETSRAARLAATDGLAASVALPLTVGWQVAGSLVGHGPDGQVVVLADGTLTGVDGRTGVELWSRPTPPSCRAGETPGSPVLCTQPGRGIPRVGAPAVGEGVATGPTDVLVVVDPATGGVLEDRTVPWPRWRAAVVGQDVVVVGIDADGRAVGMRRHAADGGLVWEYSGAVLDPRSSGVVDLVARVGPATVELDYGTAALTLRLADGAAVEPGDVVEVGRAELGGGRTAVWEHDGSAQGPEADLLRYPHGGTQVTVTSVVPDEPSVDDRSVPAVVLGRDVAAGELLLLDTRTGRHVRTQAQELGPLVDGRLVTVGPTGTLTALDARTGAELWRHSDASLLDPVRVPVTDGDRLLTLEGTPSRLVALSLVTGEVVWSLPWDAADGSQLAVAPTGTVLALARNRVTALVP